MASVNQRMFGPKEPGHPSVGERCRGCHEPFRAGDYTTLVVIGPGNDPDARARARHGRAYTGVAIEVHWACATGEEDHDG